MIGGLKTVSLGLALAFGLAGGASAQTSMKVGANIGNVPWEFQDASGKNVGFEIDLVEEIGKRNNMKVEIVNIPFQGLFAAVQSGQIDAAVSSITITKKRLESVSFAQPYYDSDQSLTVTKASRHQEPGRHGRQDRSASTPARPATCGRRRTRARRRSRKSAATRA